jgi:hypothetical protein
VKSGAHEAGFLFIEMVNARRAIMLVFSHNTPFTVILAQLIQDTVLLVKGKPQNRL